MNSIALRVTCASPGSCSIRAWRSTREPLLNAVKALYYLRARDDDAFREQFRHAEQLNRVANDALIRLYLYRGLSHTMTGNPTEGRSCYRRAKAKVRADTRPEIRTEVNQLGSVLE